MNSEYPFAGCFFYFTVFSSPVKGSFIISWHIYFRMTLVIDTVNQPLRTGLTFMIAYSVTQQRLRQKLSCYVVWRTGFQYHEILRLIL